MRPNIAGYLLAALLVLLTACSKEMPYDGADEKEGTLKLSALSLTVVNSERVMRTGGSNVSTDDFIVEIRRGTESGELVKSYKYSEIPEAVSLKAGKYVLVAKYGANQPAAWEEPYFYGSQEVEIKPNEMNDNVLVECHLANVKVTVIATERMKSFLVKDESKFDVHVGEQGTVLQFDPFEEPAEGQEPRAAYFAYVPDSRTLVVELNAPFDGNTIKKRIHTKNNVEPGVHYRITLDVQADPGSPAGEINPLLRINTTIDRLDLARPIVYDPFGDGSDDPGWRPDDGDEEGDDPAGPKGPTITPSEGINLDDFNVVTEGMECALTITSTTGLTAFTVDIVSDKLDADELEKMGLRSHLDLCNPGDLAESLGEDGLGFPIGDKVVGQKKVVFDITKFMGMLAALGEGDHEFRLEVSDSKGTTKQTLKLRTI